MAFRSPHSFKAVAIEILRALDHQAILIPARRVIVAPHKEAEPQRLVWAAPPRSENVCQVARHRRFEPAGEHGRVGHVVIHWTAFGCHKTNSSRMPSLEVG